MAEPTPSKPGAVAGIVGVLLLIAAGLVGVSTKPTKPPGTTTTTAPQRTTTTTSALPPAAAGVRFFSPDASWNQPVSRYGRAPDALQQYAERWWLYGGGSAPPGYVRPAFDAYSVPIYRAAEATTTVRVYQTVWSQRLYPFRVPAGTRIPWNPRWKPGSGNDLILGIVDEATGRAWEVTGVGQLAVNCIDAPFGPNTAAGFDPTSSGHLCVSDTRTYSNLWTATDGTTTDGRGAGINKLALVTRADEVASGRIEHALQMTIAGTMFGQPACDPIRGPDSPGFGTTCGGYVAPATKLERTNPNLGCATQVVTPEERAKTVPEGMRFALDISDAEIDAWLDSRAFPGALRSTARAFAVALRDYGWIISETGCYGNHVEIDGLNNPASAAIWATLGIVPNGTAWPAATLFDGLITRGRVYVVNPSSP